jgi:hypothetical protein
MREIHDRAFKEWEFAIEMMKAGRQTVLIRKGGIREEDGIFRVDDSEFFLLPTRDHQDPALVRPEFAEDLRANMAIIRSLSEITIDAYAVVDTIAVVDEEARLSELCSEHIWNERYLLMRLDFNPYDPLYVMILRVYALREPVRLPNRADYGGCKSWVTLERQLSTRGAVPAIPDAEFDTRRSRILEILAPGKVSR